MKIWSDFFDYVAPLVPGADPALLELHIRNAAIDFCNDTRAATYSLPITMSVGQSIYDISLNGADYTPVIINSVRIADRQLEPLNTDYLNSTIHGWRDDTGTPRAYVADDPYGIRLYPTPDEAVDVIVELAVKPSRDSIGIEDYIYDRYVEVISHGAVQRIASIPQKPYTNPQVAQMAMIEFIKGKAAARTEVYKSFTRNNTQVRLRKKY